MCDCRTCMDELAAEIREEMNMGSSETAVAIRESLARSAVLREHREQCTVGGCAECVRLAEAEAAVWDAWRALPPWSRQDTLF